MILRKRVIALLVLLAALLPAFAQQRVVCIGNSITEGYTLYGNTKPWPSQLETMLGNGYQVINRGRSGYCMLKNTDNSYWTTDNFRNALNDNPDILVIALGTNDAWPQRWNQSGGQFKNDYKDMISQFRRNGRNPRVFVCLPPYIYDNTQNAVLEQQLMPMVREVATETGATLVNMHDITRNRRSDLYNDNLHPNANGQTLLALQVYRAVKGVGDWVGAPVVPYLKNSYGQWYRDDVVHLNSGDSFALGPQMDGDDPWGGTWIWTGPGSEGALAYYATQREISFSNVNVNQAGTYYLTHVGTDGSLSQHQFTVTVDGKYTADYNLPTMAQNTVADLSYNAFMDAFLMTDNQGLKFFREGYKGTADNYRLYCWPQGLTIQMVEDRYRFRGDKSLTPLITKLLDAFSVNEDADDVKDDGVVERAIHEKYHRLAQANPNISDWTWNAFSDDLLWMSLPYIRAYLATHQTRFLDQAKWTWDYLVERAWDNTMGGGFWWNWDNKSKSGLSNNPAICLSAYLYEATGEQKYLDKAIEIYNWVYNVLRNSDGSVDENINIEHSSTPTRANGYNAYNQGTFIEGAVALYNITHDEKYLNAAIQTLNWVMTNDVNSDGVISRYKSDGTYQSELARGAAFLMEAKPELWNTATTYGNNHVATTYYSWLRKNADAAWNTRDRNYNLTGCEWGKPTVFDPSSELARKHTEVFVSSVVMEQVVPQNGGGNDTPYLMLTPYVRDKYGWRQQKELSVTIGEAFAIGPQANMDGSWRWQGPNGFASNNREISLNNLTVAQDGRYTVTFTANSGEQTTVQFDIHVFTWDAPTLTPYVLDPQGWRQDETLNLSAGMNWALGPQETKGYDDGNGKWTWTGPNGFVYQGREINFGNASPQQAGVYVATFTDQYGRRAQHQFTVNISDALPIELTPYVYDKYGWRQQQELSVTTGEKFAIGPVVNQEGTWAWAGPNGFKANSRTIVFENITTEQDGVYTATFTAQDGRTKTQQYNIHIFLWQAPTITPYVLDWQGWRQDVTLNIGYGASWALGPQEANGYDDGNGKWTWQGPNGFVYEGREINFQNASDQQSGVYIATFTDAYGRRAQMNFTVQVGGNVQSKGFVTGVDQVETSTSSAIIYDLQGRRVIQPVKNRLYIVNGKKMIFRK